MIEEIRHMTAIVVEENQKNAHPLPPTLLALATSAMLFGPFSSFWSCPGLDGAFNSFVSQK